MNFRPINMKNKESVRENEVSRNFYAREKNQQTPQKGFYLRKCTEIFVHMIFKNLILLKLTFL